MAYDFVLDSHCDTPSMLLEGLDVTQRPERGHFDFQRMRSGGVDGVFFALYTSNALTQDEALRRSLRMLEACHATVQQAKHAGLADFAFSVEEALANKRAGLSSVFLGMENALPLGQDLDLLRFFYRQGVRYLTLTHNGNNEVCDAAMKAAAGEIRWGGLSPFGRVLIAEMNRLGMMIDVSHVSDATFDQVVELSSTPVVATHSCCRALCDHPRNMTDAMIQRLASRGGVIQINFYPAFLDANFGKNPLFHEADDRMDALQLRYREAIGAGVHRSLGHTAEELDCFRTEYNEAMDALTRFPSPSYQLVVDHIEHVMRLVGPEHVGLGSDFDGISVAPDGLRDIAAYGVIREELHRRGHSDEVIRGVLGGNFLRVMRSVEMAAAPGEALGSGA